MSPPARLGCNFGWIFPLAALHGAPAANGGEMFQPLLGHGGCSGMPVTNLPPHQGNCLQHHVGPQQATSSHTPGFLATGRMRRRRASTAGMAAVMVEEGVKVLAVHSLAVPHVGNRGSLFPALAPRACIKPTVCSWNGSAGANPLHVCSLALGERRGNEAGPTSTSLTG